MADRKYPRKKTELEGALSLTPEQKLLEKVFSNTESGGEGQREARSRAPSSSPFAAQRRFQSILSREIQLMAAPLLNAGCDPKELAFEVSDFLKTHARRRLAASPPPVPVRKFVPREDQIILFLREVWLEWIRKDLLSKPLLKEYDAKAYDALMNWQKTKKMPDDIHVPTQSQVNDDFLRSKYFTLDEVTRAAAVLGRRNRK